MADGYLGYTNGPLYTPKVDRLLDSIFATPDGPYWARAGVREPGLDVTIGGSNPEIVTIGGGGGIIFDGTSSEGGSYRFHTGDTRTKNLAARPASGTSRYDEVIARLTGTATDDTREVVLEIVQGTANAAPSAPAIPAGAIRIWQLLVPATGAVTKTKRGQRVVALGGVLPVASATERDASGATIVLREDLNVLEWKSANGWTQLVNGADTGWFDLATKISGTCRYRLQQGVMWVHIDGTLATSSGGSGVVVTNAPLPSWATQGIPSPGYRGHCRVEGYPGIITVRPDGHVVVDQITGSSKGTVSALLSYPLG